MHQRAYGLFYFLFHWYIWYYDATAQLTHISLNNFQSPGHDFYYSKWFSGRSDFSPTLIIYLILECLHFIFTHISLELTFCNTSVKFDSSLSAHIAYIRCRWDITWYTNINRGLLLIYKLHARRIDERSFPCSFVDGRAFAHSLSGFWYTLVHFKIWQKKILARKHIFNSKCSLSIWPHQYCII